MAFQLPELPPNFSGIAYGIMGIAAAIVVISRLSRGPNLDAFPTVGSSNWLVSWWDGRNVSDVIQQGYEKHQSLPFKVAEYFYWTVVVSSHEHIEEFRGAPDDVFSFLGAVDERFNTNYTLGPEINGVPYHAAVVRSQLTRNLGTLYPEIRDEIVTAFNDVLGLKDNEWKRVPALSTTCQIICRASNRLFLGLPLCRDPDWINLNIQYTIDIAKGGFAIGLFPKFVRPLAAYFLAGAARRGKVHCLKHVGPIIEERLKYMHEYGNEWDGKPNDLISWLMEEAEGPELTVKALANRVLAVNVAAIHTSSNSFTHALFYLAANPQYIQPLREEVETIITSDGWSKESLGKMHKVDSFLRESQRLEGTSGVSIFRKALKDFTFSDGTFIPRGTLIGVAARALQYDDKFYENASVFDPFRFADMREKDDSIKCQFVSTGTEYLPFGHGRGACPGRFFVAYSLKTMLAHIVMTYDVKMEGDGTRPQSMHFGTAVVPNPHARVLFRKRVDRGTLDCFYPR